MGYNFDKRSVERISKETRSHERRVRGGKQAYKYLNGGGSTGLLLAKASTAISKRDKLKLGKGKAKVFDIED